MLSGSQPASLLQVKPEACWRIRSAWSDLCWRLPAAAAAACLPTWGWVTPSPIFNQHTCMHICINAHASIGAQAGAHIHLLHLWCRRRPLQGRSLSYIPCTRITFAAWLVLHALMFRFRERKHRLGRRKRPQNHVVLTRARVQAPTSLVQLVCHSPPFCVTQTSTRRENTLSFFY